MVPKSGVARLSLVAKAAPTLGGAGAASGQQALAIASAGGRASAEETGALLAAASDIVLLLDDATIIRDVVVRAPDLAAELGDVRHWIGRELSSTIAQDSLPKADALMTDAREGALGRPRHLNHLNSDGRSVPVTYRCSRYGQTGQLVAFGRDMRDLATLQQRLVAMQQMFERDYRKWRELEARHRLLFQFVEQPVLILDALRLRVVEANAAARALFGVEVGDMTGLGLAQLFAEGSIAPMEAQLSAARGAGAAEDAEVKLRSRGQASRSVVVRSVYFRQDNEGLFLLRIESVAAAAARPAPEAKHKLLIAAEQVPDAIAVTDEAGRVITANAAFLEMAQLPTEEAARGRALDEWIGSTAVDVNVLLASLRQRGSVRLFMSRLQGESGAVTPVEISAVALRSFHDPCFGFALRNVEPRPSVEAPSSARALSRSVEQLTELIGQVPLKELVRESTEVIEKLCIEAALELTGDNRASAAEMLGLSRQSLYVKLRRYGLGDLGGDARGDDEEDA